MTLAVCAKDVKFYKWPNLELCAVYGQEDCISFKSISWCCEGKQLVVTKSKGPPALLYAPSKTCEDVIEPFHILNNTASIATFTNTNKNRIAVAGAEGKVYLYDTLSKEIVQNYSQLSSSVQNLEFTAGDECLAAGCITGRIYLYNASRKPCASFLVPNSYSLSTMACNRTLPNLIAGASKEGILGVWDVESADNKLTGRNHNNIVTDIAFQGDSISTVGVDGKFVTYDLRVYNCIHTHNLNSPLSALAFIPEKYEMAVSTCNGQIRSYDMRFMTSPLHTIVAYSSWIKKIAFPNVKIEEKVFRNPRSSFSSPNKSSVDEYIPPCEYNYFLSEANSYASDNGSIEIELPPSASKVDLVNKSRKVSSMELKEFSKMLEERMRHSKNNFEELLMSKFYGLRIEISKQFIGLEEKISSSWINFVNYLKTSSESSSNLSKHTRQGNSNCSSLSKRKDNS